MAQSHVLNALIAKHAEVADRIEYTNTQLRQLLLSEPSLLLFLIVRRQLNNVVNLYKPIRNRPAAQSHDIYVNNKSKSMHVSVTMHYLAL